MITIPFVAPPLSDTVIEYVKPLGYPCTLRNVSAMSVNALYQPWRAILSMINMFLTSKTAGYDRPRHLVLQFVEASHILQQRLMGLKDLEKFDQSYKLFSLTGKKLCLNYFSGKKKPLICFFKRIREKKVSEGTSCYTRSSPTQQTPNQRTQQINSSFRDVLPCPLNPLNMLTLKTPTLECGYLALTDSETDVKSRKHVITLRSR
ncbi:hypothetical protein Tco_0669856 [Tanacetum coccineum]